MELLMVQPPSLRLVLLYAKSTIDSRRLYAFEGSQAINDLFRGKRHHLSILREVTPEFFGTV
jgi:hypothetical protein